MFSEIRSSQIRPVHPKWYNHVYAIEVLGFRWMAWDDGTPVKCTPGYPQKQRVRQLLSPRQLEDSRWKEFLEKNGGADADGTEPLAYAYCSTVGIDPPPDILDDELAVKLKMCVRKLCDDVPRDIGETLVEVVREHLNSLDEPRRKKKRRT